MQQHGSQHVSSGWANACARLLFLVDAAILYVVCGLVAMCGFFRQHYDLASDNLRSWQHRLHEPQQQTQQQIPQAP